MMLELILVVLIFINVLVTLCKNSSNIGLTSVIRLVLYCLIILLETIMVVDNLINGGPWFYNLLLLSLQVFQIDGVNQTYKQYKKDKKNKLARYKSDSNSEIVV